MSSLAHQLLQSARPLALPQTRQCSHPAGKPAALRRLATHAADPCVELLVSTCREQGGAPCCILPNSKSRGPQARGLFSLISLDSLTDDGLVNSLAAVDGHVATVCAACPSSSSASTSTSAAAGLGPASLAAQQAQQAAGPSPLVYCPEFNAYLERCLELARLRPDLGPAPAVLLLQIVSRLGYAADERLRDSFRAFYLHLQVTLETAAELHAEALTPQVALAVFEAWARLGAVPMNSRPFGLAVREHIKMGRFTAQELCRLLGAMASLRAAHPRYRPDQYDVADICGGLLASGLGELPAPHLKSVAASLGAFPWPVYQCVLPLLEATAQEGVRRQATGEITPPSGAAVVASALASARSLNPRLGAEMEGKLAGWHAQARVATGNILSFAELAAGAGSGVGPAGSAPISAFL